MMRIASDVLVLELAQGRRDRSYAEAGESDTDRAVTLVGPTKSM